MGKIGWILALILAVAFAWVYFQKPEPVIPGTVVQRDTVIIHDTVTTVKHVTDFVVRRQTLIDTFKIDPGILPSETTLADTPACYSFSQTYQDGEYIKAEMCSRYFPIDPPGDLSGIIKRLPGNDTSRTYYRTDTIPKIIFKKPFVSPWIVLGVGVAAGAIGAIVVLK